MSSMAEGENTPISFPNTKGKKLKAEMMELLLNLAGCLVVLRSPTLLRRSTTRLEPVSGSEEPNLSAK